MDEQDPEEKKKRLHKALSAAKGHGCLRVVDHDESGNAKPFCSLSLDLQSLMFKNACLLTCKRFLKVQQTKVLKYLLYILI